MSCEFVITDSNVGNISRLVSSLKAPPKLFILLFLFRYVRLLVSLVAAWLYKPIVSQHPPVVSKEDVTVIVPTVDPAGVNLKECIHSIRQTDPSEIIIVTAGAGRDGESNLEILEQDWKGYPAIRLMNCEVVNKRKQLYTALPTVSVIVFGGKIHDFVMQVGVNATGNLI